jgi:hypothetical protein
MSPCHGETIAPCLAVVGALYCPAQSALAQSRQPDILIVLCDDFNPFYAGFAGDPNVRTPHLDALARDSSVFSRWKNIYLHRLG